MSDPNDKFGNSGPTTELPHNHTHLVINFQSDASWKIHIHTV